MHGGTEVRRGGEDECALREEAAAGLTAYEWLRWRILAARTAAAVHRGECGGACALRAGLAVKAEGRVTEVVGIPSVLESVPRCGLARRDQCAALCRVRPGTSYSAGRPFSASRAPPIITAEVIRTSKSDINERRCNHSSTTISYVRRTVYTPSLLSILAISIPRSALVLTRTSPVSPCRQYLDSPKMLRARAVATNGTRSEGDEGLVVGAVRVRVVGVVRQCLVIVVPEVRTSVFSEVDELSLVFKSPLPFQLLV